MPRLTKKQIIKEISSGKLLEVLNPNIVYWNWKAYKLIGTSSHELSPSEILSLSLELPGQDFSKLAYAGKLNSSLIMGFAEKINKNTKEKIDLTNNSTLDAEAFIDKWFSRIHNSQNKVLMNTLRMSKLTEELGSGKNRIFRQMIEQCK